MLREHGGGATVREFPKHREIGKKMQKKKNEKKQHKDVVSGQSTGTVKFAGLKVYEGDCSVVAVNSGVLCGKMETRGG